MPAEVHVVARFLARPGREADLAALLTSLLAPTRQEAGCHQYDLLVNPADPRDFCFVERWLDDASLDRHLATAHVRAAIDGSADLVEAPPDVRRYRPA
jgi:quinol monooxygenase YgiN